MNNYDDQRILTDEERQAKYANVVPRINHITSKQKVKVPFIAKVIIFLSISVTTVSIAIYSGFIIFLILFGIHNEDFTRCDLQVCQAAITVIAASYLWVPALILVIGLMFGFYVFSRIK